MSLTHVVNSFLRKTYSNNDKLERFKNEKTFLKYQVDAPEITSLIDREWMEHIVNLAIENLKKSMSEKVIKVFLLSTKGTSDQEISKTTGISENSIPVYKTRVKQKLKAEISALRSLLE